MGFIDIDDRDVVNNITTGLQLNADVIKQRLMDLKINNPTVKVVSLGHGKFQLSLASIVSTGANVITHFNIPYMHELIQISIKHTDSADVNSVNVLAYSLSKRHHPNLWMLLLNIEETTASDIIDEYIDYYMESGEYRFQSNTINTDLLYVSVIIKATGV